MMLCGYKGKFYVNQCIQALKSSLKGEIFGEI